VKAAFDTSVLVAALVAAHPKHDRAIRWVRAAAEGEIEAECSWHAVAETWSVLTRLPIAPPISPELARAALERLGRHIPPAPLRDTVYRGAIERCAERGLRSGAVSDALHLVAAEQSGADVLLTFNAADFTRLATGSSPRILVPPDPPAVDAGES